MVTLRCTNPTGIVATTSTRSHQPCALTHSVTLKSTVVKLRPNIFGAPYTVHAAATGSRARAFLGRAEAQVPRATLTKAVRKLSFAIQANEMATNLVFVASECAPWSCGLGDMASALPKALAERGHRVMVVVPRYCNYPEAYDTGVRVSYEVFGKAHEVGYFHAFVDGVDFVFIDHPCFHDVAHSIHSGDRMSQNFRFSLLSKAALEAVWHVAPGGYPYEDLNTVFIANGWQTALVPFYLNALYRDQGKMLGARSILVLHNLAFQGRGPFGEVLSLDIPKQYLEHFHLDDLFGGPCMNTLKAGLLEAHRWVAVSNGYAEEIQTQKGGMGLAPTLQSQTWKMNGVVNGIDYDAWSPDRDAYLEEADAYTTYGFTREGILEGKAQCKAALQQELGLPAGPHVPLLAFVGQLDTNKGVDMIFEAAGWLMEQDIQLVLLGCGDSDFEDRMRSLEEHHGHKCKAWVGQSVEMEHRIIAASDILLMPSRFEPCGLNQMYAQRYGTVPVVQAVGGLQDTVESFNPWENSGSGWMFEPNDMRHVETRRFIDTVNDALTTYREYRESFIGIQLRGMAKEFSWDAAAKSYEDIIIQAKQDDYRG
ncbi:hypothetical protein CYMTET_7406 [Cymbomonas tetramitiformis]|uniref:Starch synthase, chloroplastic/amyloplastic n=1 Tax=Cymbomonas tetramitiformis TaxID=36881 RepID=A0AAE0GVJ5_9CHLO|nr:hypothetical protein CYMTET_7406 [Cymbomonas tetramitiformis]